MTLVRYRADVPSIALADRIRVEQSTLVVPGAHVGLEGYLRIWYGGRHGVRHRGAAADRRRPVHAPGTPVMRLRGFTAFHHADMKNLDRITYRRHRGHPARAGAR